MHASDPRRAPGAPRGPSSRGPAGCAFAAPGGSRFATEQENEFGSLGPLTATLRWLPNARAPKAYTRDEAARLGGRGGVYIAVDAGQVPPQPLKVGRAETFAVRMGNADYRAHERRLPGLRFYLAEVHVAARGRHGVGGVAGMVEYALARTLLRAGKALPLHRLPYRVARIVGDVDVVHPLPAPLKGLLAAAYRVSGGRDAKKQVVMQYQPQPDRILLKVRRGATATWELGEAADAFRQSPFDERRWDALIASWRRDPDGRRQAAREA